MVIHREFLLQSGEMVVDLRVAFLANDNAATVVTAKHGNGGNGSAFEVGKDRRVILNESHQIPRFAFEAGNAFFLNLTWCGH